MALALESLRRHPRVGGAVIGLAAVVVATVIVIVVWASHIGSTSDNFAATGDVLTGAAFLLALIAAVLALIAYAQSVRRPALQVWASLTPNIPTLSGDEALHQPQRVHVSARPQVSMSDRAEWRVLGPETGLQYDLRVNVMVTNNGDATARNVTVIVDITGLTAPLLGPLPRGWAVVTQEDALRLQWEGGADLGVHPGRLMSRVTDPVPLTAVVGAPSAQVSISATVAADGSPQSSRTRTLEVIPGPAGSVW